jgi:hypothetical protein
MDKFKESLDSILILYRDNVDLLTISSSIEDLFKEYSEQINKSEIKKSEKIGYDKGFKCGLFATSVTQFVIMIFVLAGLFCTIKGCNDSYAQQNIRFNYILGECTKGNYSICRSGWSEFNTSSNQTNEGLWNVANEFCYSFEETYYRKTKSPLILDEKKSYFKIR